MSERGERVTVRETVMEEESRENESVLERKYHLYTFYTSLIYSLTHLR